MSTAMDVERSHDAPGHGHDGRPSFVAHHYDTAGQQESAAKLGTWIFLATELLMFSGLFLAYFYMRSQYPEMVLEYHQDLNKWLGGLNTVVLITSSLTMALAVRSAQTGDRKRSSMLLLATIALAFGFLVIKYIEYSAKFEHGLYPGMNYFAQHIATDAGDMIQKGWYGGPQLFFGVYFLMTGLHGLHVLIGIGLLTWLVVRTNKGEFSEHYFTPVENVGLYWHLVDLIWIFLFPLLYLVK